MIPSWSQSTIEEVMEAIIDYRGKTPKKTKEGIPLITAKIVKNGTILEPNEYISPNDYDDWMRRGLPKIGDIVVTTEAPLGEIAQLKSEKVALAQRLITLRGKSDILDNIFLKYIMMSEYVQNQLKSRSSGTTVHGIKQKELRKVMLPIPPILEQNAIARILGTLDDKIECNRRMNATLEAMAQAIFKSWFVDFDPVRAKDEGRQPVGMDADTAALFPEAFEEMDCKEVPVGWELGKVKDILTIFRKNINPGDYPEDTFLHYSIPSYDQSKSALLESGIQIKSNKYLIDNDAVLISKLNPEINRVWYISGKNSHKKVCSTEFIVCQPNDGYNLEYLDLLFKSDNFMTSFQSLVTGTSKSHQRVKPNSFLEMKIILPSQKVIEIFEQVMKPFFRYQIFLSEQSRTLAELRDTLLPKLISGEVRVPDAMLEATTE